MAEQRTRWYKDAIIYQIYPRSFKDSNNDGIGDLKGVIEKLDYLEALGINTIWLSPCYQSPNDDNGYDISNYRDIMPEFGTLEIWKEMIAGMHRRGIKLVMDLVVNHTSDEHSWFQESKKSIKNPYRNYYIWRKGLGKDGQIPPNNWTSRFGGSAWSYDETTKEWYLHLFTKKQPDLNWDNPKVREEVQDLVKYWLDLGVDGFRCDVITYISKKEGLPDGKWNLAIRGDEHFTHGPNIHQYLQELNNKVLSKYDCMTVGEATGVTIAQGLEYTAEDRDELDTVFTFEHVEADTYFKLLPRKFRLTKLKKVLADWQLGLAGKGWNSLYYENHDQPRSLPRFVGEYGNNRVLAAKMLAISYFFLQGTPYIYQGQEIGMTNCHFQKLDEMKDVMVKYILNTLGPLRPLLEKVVLKVLNKRARDHARTPMQWDSTANAGFSDATPWMAPNPNYTDINVAASLADPDSVLNFYKKLIAYRKDNAIIKNGSYKESHAKSEEIYCYERWWHGEKLYIICNFTNKNVVFSRPGDAAYSKCSLEFSNYKDSPISLDDMTLRPYEAIVYKVL